MHYACWRPLPLLRIKKMSQYIRQNMIFSPKNKLFTKENVFVQINPQEYGNFSRKCNLYKKKMLWKSFESYLVDQKPNF
jgi:hypothetical protein